ncbi:RidA family protein [Leucobacter luti]|uniref:Enamine deaminase RidA (YjgF/YER057c/UK114 family) n=1 Tax=Leucobacter luti TaxID=340320 RepID=A0A4R6S7J6_9MICO|nr:RidA family protein [Leucobacter luti]MCW2288679.1 enamine deaminase RidA (YjgF/YER057c/UK114 family) [Leucobacter luti]QYM75399.1 RidA family protein [Leucobacter luti]TCK45166.1 enamine deaminase RidA (YjgF/YER057c/UK114 family) [Leucobacter luti]TDP95691.1 enamine deaminase RidA (YjgF/YER057c/UK114 family) [Leucobacter luti]
MSRTVLTPDGIHPAPGFSHVTIAPPGTTVYIAGQMAIAPDFSVVGGDDLGQQTAAAMRNVKLAMDAAGLTWDDVVRRTIYTTAPTEFGVITAAIEEVQGSDRHPSQTIVGISGLAIAGALIEIEVTGVVPA